MATIENARAQEITRERQSTLERYRLTVYGERLNDLDMASTAISDQAYKLSVVSKAIEGFISEAGTLGVETKVLMGSCEIMNDATQAIEEALAILGDLDTSEN